MQLILENFCIGAIEKQKLVYILNRDAQAHLTISSPLEAHKSNTLVYNIVGVDVGFALGPDGHAVGCPVGVDGITDG